MPALARKLLVIAAIDGLLLQPLHNKGAEPKKERAAAVKVGYKTGGVTPVNGAASADDRERGKSFEAFGIVGLLTVSASSFLISITRREQVAQIHGKPIYVVTEVALTPLASRAEALESVSQTAASLKRRADGLDSETESDTDDENEANAAISDDVDSDNETHTKGGSKDRQSSIVEDVIIRKGGYGRFAQRWFSSNGWNSDRRRDLGFTGKEAPKPSKDVVDIKQDDGQVPADLLDLKQETAEASVPQDVAATLLPKLLRTTSLLFGSSRSYYFSYDQDLTRSYINQKKAANTDSTLYKEVDPLYFWNRSVIKPFIEAKQDHLVLPLMQGFVGQREFSMEISPRTDIGQDDVEMKSWVPPPSQPRESFEPPAEGVEVPQEAIDETEDGDAAPHQPPSKAADSRPFLLTLISRRSVKRAGLRYLRRGVDIDGNTANSVETEQILSSPDWQKSSYSFLQIRGSIPLFFAQTPYAFKPVPQLQQSEETNSKAFTRHFQDLQSRYGQIQVASLVEKHGPEQRIGEEYKKVMAKYNDNETKEGKKVGFEWFDFHAMCRGMKFENVMLLFDSIGSELDAFGYSVESEGQITSKQSGVLRTNCMDCLDRTNVVQSACGRRALEIQLKAEGIDMGAQTDQTTQWFNTMWADNGDAISKQYASTAALKGDFTRTRQRNYKGALTDMGLSISRFYSGIVNDYFSQAAIDFLLGSVTALVFEDFEASLSSQDPAMSMSRMRQQAIDVSSRLVVADDSEELIGGWALLSPQSPNTIKSFPFEESVMLLTDKALYACRFDWNMEKVSSFERVDLAQIVGIKYGTYITSTLSPAQADEKINIGLVVTYKAERGDSIQRVNTRSLSSSAQMGPDRTGEDLLQGTAISNTPGNTKNTNSEEQRVVALKALPARTAVASDADAHTGPPLSEAQQVKLICAEIERLVKKARAEAGCEGEAEDLIKQGDIIGLAEAKKATGLLEQLGHSLKKLVWA